MKDNRGASARGRRWFPPSRALQALLALALPEVVCAQLPPSSAAEAALGGYAAAATRGFGAVATNPAGLGLPRPARTTVAILPLALGCGMGPVTCADVDEFEDDVLPDAVREEWLRRIEARGRQAGQARGSATLAAAVGIFGFQVSSTGVAAAELNPDAAELLLFGNAGRTGEPREFRLGGSRLDSWVVTTFAAGVGIPLNVEIGDAPGQAFAVGATVKYTIGNVFYAVRDLGTFFSGDPLQILARFPMMQTRSAPELRAADGVGLDVGFAWEAAPWSFGLTVENVVNTFRWDVEELVFRPATALFTQDAEESDFAPRPGPEAPAELRADVEAFRFGPRLEAGFFRELGARFSLAGQVGFRLGGSSDVRSANGGGLGIEYRAAEGLPLRAHAGVEGGGVRLGGGAGLRLGRVHVWGAGSYHSEDGLDGPEWMLTVSLGGP